MQKPTSRRRFLRDGSMAAAALTSVATASALELRAHFLCVTCGTQYPDTGSANPPEHCPICEDERQYVGPDGQQWTTLSELRSTHKNVFKKEEDDLYSINTEPKFGI